MQQHRLPIYSYLMGATDSTGKPEGRPTELGAEAHRKLAVALFNRTWELLDKDPRSDDEEAEMLTAAFGSRFHWLQIGDAKNFSVSDWQVSRVAAVLGYAELADFYGRRSLHIAASSELGPFYVGYGHEAVARAACLIGNRDDCTRHLRLARDLLEQVPETRDRELLAADLDDISH